MSTIPQKNLFYYYRGPTPREDPAYSERQLENNLTKALVTVLELAEPQSMILGQFLSRLAGVRVPQQGRLQFALQRQDIERPDVPKKVVLGIAPERGVDKGRRRTGKGLPDAWIWCDSYAVLIECKVRGKVNAAQLERHCRTAQGWRGVPKRIVTWEQVSETLGRAANSAKDKLSQTLLDHLLDHMERTVVISSKFRPNDLDFFVAPVAERDESWRRIVQERAFTFCGAVLGEVKGDLNTLYPSKCVVAPGTLRRDALSHWITLSSKPRGDRCHFTIRLSGTELVVDCFAPHKSFTRRLSKRILDDPETFTRLLRSTSRRSGRYFLRVRHAYYKSPQSGYKGQAISRWADVAGVDVTIADSEIVRTILQSAVKDRLEAQTYRPEILLICTLSRAEVLREKDLVGKTADIIHRMVPYLEYALEAQGYL